MELRLHEEVLRQYCTVSIGFITLAKSYLSFVISGMFCVANKSPERFDKRKTIFLTLIQNYLHQQLLTD